MNTTTTVTATGEVTIPESVRAAAGLMPGMPLEVSAGNGGVLITVAPRIKDALAAAGLTAYEAVCLFWESVARNGKATLDLIAPKAAQTREG